MPQFISKLLIKAPHRTRCALIIGITVVHASNSGCSSSKSGTSLMERHDQATDVTQSNPIDPWTISFEPDPRDLANLGKGDFISTATETDADAIAIARAAIERGLSKYSESLRERMDLRVLCVANITINHQRVSGFNSKENGIVLLTTRNAENTIDSERIEQILHSELSTILVWHNLAEFPTELWASANPEGFKYSGQDPLQFAGEKPVATLEDLEHGFLGEYAQIDPTQDINRVAEQVMMESPRYAAALKRYPRLRQKALAYAIFLRRIDPPLGERAVAFVRAATKE